MSAKHAHALAESPATVAKRPKRVVMVANRTGGQGKTLVSQLLLDYLARRGRVAVPLAADALSGLPGDEANRGSKLSRVLHGTQDFGIGRDASLDGGASDALAYWDPLGEALVARDSVLDVGANVIDPILSWLRAAGGAEDLASEVVFDLVVPVTRARQSIADAGAMIHDIMSSGAVPLRNVYVVRNRFGASDGCDQDVVDMVTRVRAQAAVPREGRLPLTGGVALIDLGACDTTTGTRVVTQLDAERRYVGVANDQDGTFAVPPSPFGDNPPQAVAALADAARAKIAEDNGVVSKRIKEQTVFARSRDLKVLRQWFSSLAAQLDAVRFDIGVPLGTPGAEGAFVPYVAGSLTSREIAALGDDAEAPAADTSALPL